MNEKLNNPAYLFVSSFPSSNTRRNYLKCLNTATDVLSNGAFIAPEKPLKDDFDTSKAYRAAMNQYKVDRADYDNRYLSIRWQDISNQHLTMVKSRLEDEYSFQTINLVLSAMRGVVKTSWKLGLINAETRDRVTDVENIKGNTLPAGRDVKNTEFLLLLEDCAHDTNITGGIRDMAILLVMRNLGLRRNEIVDLKLENLDLETGEVKIEGAKGNKSRIDFVSKQTLDAIQRWIAVRNGSPSDSLFVTLNRGGNITDRKLTTQALYQMIKRRCDNQKLKDITPMDLRRTMITRALESGVDAITVAQRAGHSSVDSTKRYDKRSSQRLKVVAELLDDFIVPEVGE